MTSPLNLPQKPALNDWMTIGLGLAQKLSALGEPAKPSLLARALHDLLDGQDETARSLRLDMQIHLARVSNAAAIPVPMTYAMPEEMLSTQEAAQLMECSRPYVAMLIDAEKLPGAVKSKGGHRKVPKSSVLQWIDDAKAAGAADSKDYRQAAADADMYSIPDEVYLSASKR